MSALAKLGAQMLRLTKGAIPALEPAAFQFLSQEDAFRWIVAGAELHLANKEKERLGWDLELPG
jgi:hypothetical protein